MTYVELTLSWLWSPEQISGIGNRIGMPVSYEWIYRHVAADKARGGKLYKALRQGISDTAEARTANFSRIEIIILQICWGD